MKITDRYFFKYALVKKQMLVHLQRLWKIYLVNEINKGNMKQAITGELS